VHIVYAPYSDGVTVTLNAIATCRALSDRSQSRLALLPADPDLRRWRFTAPARVPLEALSTWKLGPPDSAGPGLRRVGPDRDDGTWLKRVAERVPSLERGVTTS
jgi:hypothetical protein